MDYFYMDTDTGSDASNGTAWGLAKLTLEGLLAVMAPGDVGYVQGLTVDSTIGNRSFTSPGTLALPCLIYGVKDGTTNTGVNVVASDLSVRKIDTLVKIENTGGGSDITFFGVTFYYGINFTWGDRLLLNGIRDGFHFNGCELSGEIFRLSSAHIVVTLVNCRLDLYVWLSNAASGSLVEIGGGEWVTTGNYLFRSPMYNQRLTISGVDLSLAAVTNLVHGTSDMGGGATFNNCLLNPASGIMEAIPTDSLNWFVELIGCSANVAGKAPGESYQDYTRYNHFGITETEQTIVRTGGATDSASGAFSYALVQSASSTVEGVTSYRSPILSVWVTAGAKIITVYIANSSAATDYLEDEVWCEFYVPNANDTSQHEQIFEPGLARLINSTTPVTDDTTSVWGAGGNNAQKLTIAITPGFEGVVYARVHLSKRQATPDTLYIDPKIEVT